MPIQVDLLLLIVVANGAPLLLFDLLREHWNHPVDGGWKLADGERLFGPSVTLRGFIAAVMCTAMCAVLLDHPFGLGITVGLLAMLGDACSSFVKRRMKLASGHRALGLDQIPEAAFPLMAVRSPYGLGWVDIGLMVVAFFFLELLLSRILYHLHLRERPY